VAHFTAEKVLGVGVHSVIFNDWQLFFEHPTNRVASAAANAYHLDQWRGSA
jgi:hypothetical protein